MPIDLMGSGYNSKVNSTSQNSSKLVRIHSVGISVYLWASLRNNMRTLNEWPNVQSDSGIRTLTHNSRFYRLKERGIMKQILFDSMRDIGDRRNVPDKTGARAPRR